jgi:hypothetical protein
MKHFPDRVSTNASSWGFARGTLKFNTLCFRYEEICGKRVILSFKLFLSNLEGKDVRGRRRRSATPKQPLIMNVIYGAACDTGGSSNVLMYTTTL